MSTISLLRGIAEPLAGCGDMNLGPLIDRLSDARVVLLGAPSYGSSETYRVRAAITKGLIRRGNVGAIALLSSALEAWWLDQYVRSDEPPTIWPPPLPAFPGWMWNNQETFLFLRWLRQFNVRRSDVEERTGVWGLDRLDFYEAVALCLEYVHRLDPERAVQARARFASITPWTGDRGMLQEMSLSERLREEQPAFLSALRKRLGKRLQIVERDRSQRRYLRLPVLRPAQAESLYARIYACSASAWLARSAEMFATLRSLYVGLPADRQIVVWGHNTEVGRVAGLELPEHEGASVGQLCGRALAGVQAVGFGVAAGSVLAAREWDGAPEPMLLREAHPESYERLCTAVGPPAFVLPLHNAAPGELREMLGERRLHRAVGAVYHPDTEVMSHYTEMSLVEQFDEYVWFDRSDATRPLP
jgi:erythromycin esterase-like protein